ncbi:MAG: hypothetical protein AAGA81_01065 [Acidobacteriota bacterium]
MRPRTRVRIASGFLVAGLMACAEPSALQEESSDGADPERQVTTVDAPLAEDLRVERLLDRPIIGPDLDPSIGVNIQGPSLIRVPDWVEGPLGRYYLYFADHKGRYIRLAYADELLGPWSIYEPGVLPIEESYFLTEPPEATPEQVAAFEERWNVSLSHDLLKEVTTPHIASPDVHVDDEERRIVLYFHGLEGVGEQATRVALSTDGLSFEVRPELLGRTYLRAFRRDGFTYGLAMPGQLYRSRDGLTDFETGPLLFGPDMRHSAVLQRGDELLVFWTQVGEAPERILLSRIDLTPDWSEWREGPAVEVLRPEQPWEGAEAPLEPSVRSSAYGTVNQLRDPAIYQEDGRVFLLYAVAGESGIAIAELFFSDGGGDL